MDTTQVLDRVEATRSAAEQRQVHDSRTASILGVALGVSFGICFLTGVWSHLQQHPPGWLADSLPFGPVGLYRFTQGLHVITGLASIPLLLAKLYAVSPQLLKRPSLRDTVNLMERAAVLPLVGGSLFLLATGAANIARWYPWKFFFPVGHWWAAWLVLGATMIHVALKAPTVRRTLGRARGEHGVAEPADPEPATVPGELTRRGLLLAVGGAAGVLTLLTAGQTVPYLRRLTLLAPRRPDIGPQGLPVNRTADAAGTTDLAGADYRLVVTSARGEQSFTVEDLRALPQRTEELVISCVEGWSAMAVWTGVSVRDVLRAAGLEAAGVEGAEPANGTVTVTSAQQVGGYRSSELTVGAIADPRCLLALELNGEPLAPDHGAPVRLIAPNRPGVMQTKWVTGLELA